MRELFRKGTAEEKADKKRQREKRREWEKQFPPLSCHPPYVSSEEMEKLERISIF